MACPLLLPVMLPSKSVYASSSVAQGSSPEAVTRPSPDPDASPGVPFCLRPTIVQVPLVGMFVLGLLCLVALGQTLCLQHLGPGARSRRPSQVAHSPATLVALEGGMSSRQTQVVRKYITSASLFLKSKAVPLPPPQVFIRSPEQAHRKCSEDQAASGFFLMSPNPLQEGTGHPDLDHCNSPLATAGLGCPSTRGTRVVSVKHIPLLPHPSVRPCGGWTRSKDPCHICSPAISFCLPPPPQTTPKDPIILSYVWAAPCNQGAGPPWKAR